ncbi:unnamed protein product [Paramecium sonneborni]|uniref:Transmembrane protein 107 n=1 Tax=Paramecium sonneborni TaxID=65129 RepID=A0A8S1R1F5_9CILI|nr:unnamed protein product [Paramecium sonneborni]
MSAAEILVPTKFISQMIQLIITCVIYQSQYENLLNFPNDQLAASSLQAGVTLSVIFLVVEMIILTTGWTMNFEKTMLTQIILHSLGSVILTWFILDSWDYSFIWAVFSLFCLLPLLLECITIANAILFRRSIIRSKS